MKTYLDTRDEILATKDEIGLIAEEDLAAVTGGAKAPSSPAEEAVRAVVAYYSKLLSSIF
jgi:hypothetical protein